MNNHKCYFKNVQGRISPLSQGYSLGRLQYLHIRKVVSLKSRSGLHKDMGNDKLSFLRPMSYPRFQFHRSMRPYSIDELCISGTVRKFQVQKVNEVVDGGEEHKAEMWLRNNIINKY